MKPSQQRRQQRRRHQSHSSSCGVPGCLRIVLLLGIVVSWTTQWHVLTTILTSVHHLSLFDYGHTTTTKDHRHQLLSSETKHNTIGSDRWNDLLSLLEPQQENRVTPPLFSDVHCVGETFLPHPLGQAAWLLWYHRSCSVRHVCYDPQQQRNSYDTYAYSQSTTTTTSHEEEEEEGHGFVRLQPSKRHEALVLELSKHSQRRTTQLYDTMEPMSMVANHKNTTRGGVPYLSTMLTPPWAQPWWNLSKQQHDVDENVNRSSHRSVSHYLKLPDHVVVVPITTRNRMRHSVWDLFLPMYMMLSDFALLDDHEILLLAVGHFGGTSKNDDQESSARYIEAFLPLMRTKKPVVYTLPNHGENNKAGHLLLDRMICAPKVALSIRLISMSGVHDQPALNLAGRGHMLWEFRNYMLSNIGLAMDDDHLQVRTGIHTASSTNHVYIVVVVGLSDETVSLIQHTFVDEDHVQVQHYTSLETLPLKERVRLVLKSSMFISTGSATDSVYGIFLPRGGSMVIVGHDREAMTDYETIWSHLSHARSHWLPVGSTRMLLKLIEKEVYAFRDWVVLANDPSFGAEPKPTDALFAGFRAAYVKGVPKSDIHCTDENDEFSRVCEYRTLCFDTTRQVFVLPRSAKQLSLDNSVTEQMDMSSISSNKGVYLAGVAGRGAFAFEPEPIPSSSITEGYYTLDSHVLWLFFNPIPMTMKNPGHAIWDILLPLYLQQLMFLSEEMKPLVFRMNHRCVLNHPKIGSGCARNVHRFLSLLGIFNSTPFDAIELTGSDQLHSSIVCGRSAAAGMPTLTDHGTNQHGKVREDYVNPHNVGRGNAFWNFRQYILQKIGLSDVPITSQVVTLSLNSSSSPSRNRSFHNQIAALQRYDETGVSVQSFQFSTISLEEQIRIVCKSSMYVSTAGGSTAIAMFLPRGASLILFYDDVDETTEEEDPTYLDFDFWNNAGYLRVHWLPISTMDEDVGVFIALVQYELEAQQRLQSAHE